MENFAKAEDMDFAGQKFHALMNHCNFGYVLQQP